MDIDEIKAKITSKIQEAQASLAENEAFLKVSDKLPFLAKMVGGASSSTDGGNADEQTHQMEEEDKTGEVNIDEMDDLDSEETYEASDEDGTEADIELEDENEEDDEPKSLLAQIKNDPEKRKKAIMGGAVLAIGWLLLGEDGGKPKTAPVETPVAKSQQVAPVKKALPKLVDKKKPAIEKKKALGIVNKIQKMEAPVIAKKANSGFSNDLEMKKKTITKVAMPAKKVEMVKKKEVKLDTTKLGLDTDTNPVQQRVSPRTIPKPKEAGMGESISSNLEGVVENDKTQDVLAELEKQMSSDTKVHREQLIYTAPRYGITGRGLVYSCKGRHWACINGENYGKCEKNHKFNSSLQKNLECFPADIYATIDDCNRAQQVKINTNKTTKFCQR